MPSWVLLVVAGLVRLLLALVQGCCQRAPACHLVLVRHQAGRLAAACPRRCSPALAVQPGPDLPGPPHPHHCPAPAADSLLTAAAGAPAWARQTRLRTALYAAWEVVLRWPLAPQLHVLLSLLAAWPAPAAASLAAACAQQHCLLLPLPLLLLPAPPERCSGGHAS